MRLAPTCSECTGVTLSYNLHRNYARAWGRYLEVDPVAAAPGLSRAEQPAYAYALNDPLDYVDTSGLIALADACERALEEARNFARKIRREFAAAEFFGRLNRGHANEISEYQNGLRNALRKVRIHCPCPEGEPELAELEDLAERPVTPTSRREILFPEGEQRETPLALFEPVPLEPLPAPEIFPPPVPVFP